MEEGIDYEMCTHAADKLFVSEREREPLTTHSLRLIPPLDRVRLQILYTCHTRRIGSIAAVVCVSFASSDPGKAEHGAGMDE